MYEVKRSGKNALRIARDDLQRSRAAPAPAGGRPAEQRGMKPIFYSPAPRHPDDEAAPARGRCLRALSRPVDDPALAEIVREARPNCSARRWRRSRSSTTIANGFPSRSASARARRRAPPPSARTRSSRPDQCFSVADASADPRFAGNPLVLSGPHIRFYMGMPLQRGRGMPLGALCVLDDKARADPHPDILAALEALARKPSHRLQVVAARRSRRLWSS